MRPLVPVVPLVAALALTAGCSGEQETYCDAVAEHQAELSDVAAGAAPGAAFGALEAYRDLREKAPGDIGDEWSQVVSRLEALQEALDDAGVDPASYDPRTTPEGLPDEERRAIEVAARALGDAATVEAMGGVEQHALDVCQTPLSQ